MERNITSVLEQVAEIESELAEHHLSKSELFMTEAGELRVGGQPLGLQPSAMRQLAQQIGCPVEFYQLMPCDLRASITNRLIGERGRRGKRCAERLRITTSKGEVVGISNAKLLSISATDVLHAVFDAIPDNLGTDIGDLEVRRFQPMCQSLVLEITTPKAVIETRPGDIVAAGLSVRHSCAGLWATKISTYLHRLVCANGMVVPVCQHDKRLRVRRLDKARFCMEDMLATIHRISQMAWDELSVKLQAFAALAERRLDDPGAVLRDLAKRLRLNKGLTQSVEEAFEQDELGIDNSQLGVINALSRTATHHPGINELLRLRLLEASGVLSQEQVHRCPLCLSVVYGRQFSQSRANSA